MTPHALIVDDRSDNRYLLRVLLEGHGYAVEEAGHGAEALVKARQSPPTLVISDLLMPVMDGFSLLKEWRTDHRLKTIPFVVYTATYTEPKDERLALNLGADSFIIKPAEPDAFMARIREVLTTEPDQRTRDDNLAPTAETFLKDHNEVLVRKLEKKARLLEQANEELRAEIAERKQAEETLRLRDRAIQAVSQGILITDPNLPDNPIVFVSAGFERITGYRADEVTGKNCRILQGGDTDRKAVEAIRAAVSDGRGCSLELLNYRKDGTPFWNQLSIRPILDAADRLTHFVGVLTDVTERRRFEEHFRQAQKMEAIGQLAGGVAHDFNNLLTIINGYSDLLLQVLAPDDPSRELLVEIRKAGERSAGLTRQLLAFSRKQVLAPRVLDLNAVVTDAERLLHRMIGEDVRLTTVLTPGLGHVRADPGQVEQVLMNLAVNARDAMPTGGHLTVETRNVDLNEEFARTHIEFRPGPHVLLTVSDSGCGMTDEVKSRIFEPFFTTKDPGKGTGLGLATVFGIVRQSQGIMDVYSEVGVGTTFKIYLPRVADSVTAALPPTGNRRPPPGTETILLVEDEDGVRTLSRHVLTGCGYAVLEAEDGIRAARIAEEHDGPIDLLITDVVMPGSGGRELAERLRRQFPALKVLYMSGYTDDAVVRHGVLSEAVEFLQKPFAPFALGLKVREILDRARGGQADA